MLVPMCARSTTPQMQTCKDGKNREVRVLKHYMHLAALSAKGVALDTGARMLSVAEQVPYASSPRG